MKHDQAFISTPQVTEEVPHIALSIVIPLYNEEESVQPLCASIVRAVEPLGRPFEVILVDDGSEDETFARARAVAEGDARFRVFRLSKNCGQTAALYAGLEQARGKIIVTMDGDLQNDPEDIGLFLARIDEGYDMVAGWREQRQDHLLLRTIPSRIANWLIRKVMGTPIKDNGCALRAYRAEIIKKFRLYSEMHRLLPTMMALTGASIAQVKVRHHPRRYGHSKYGLSRIYKVLLDMISLKTVLTAFGLPLFGFGIASILSLGIGGVFLLAAVRQWMVAGLDESYIFLGMAMLWGLLGVALLLFGLLCGLVYSKAGFRSEHLLKVDMI